MITAEEIAQKLPGLRTSAREVDRTAYARDLQPRYHLGVRQHHVSPHPPRAIVWPETPEDVAKLVTLARTEGLTLVPFGAGSGVCGAVKPDDRTVVVDLKRMNRVHAIDKNEWILDADAGCMGLPLEEELARNGATLGHFPSSISCSTLGGWIAARSAGQCSSRYGKIEDMVESLDIVTGVGEITTIHSRHHGPSLVPLVVGSEGTLAIVTRARMRLHPVPKARAFGAWTFPSTEAGWDALRRVMQHGLRPAVARLYDPFDAMIARRGTVKAVKGANVAGKGNAALGTGIQKKLPSMGLATALRPLLKVPKLVNALVEAAGARVFGGALIIMIFEGEREEAERDLAATRARLEPAAGWEGEAPATRWLQNRYAVSYRQAPLIRAGYFLDTMEVASTWERLGALFHGVSKALGESAFVMAHMSHAYPDGCCIYFTFAGDAGDPARAERVYDETWTRALAAASDAGGTIAHHHGVGRSKAPALPREVGAGGVAAFAALRRAFDPDGVLNPGALVP